MIVCEYSLLYIADNYYMVAQPSKSLGNEDHKSIHCKLPNAFAHVMPNIKIKHEVVLIIYCCRISTVSAWSILGEVTKEPIDSNVFF